ncbi:hypothetical protein DPF_1862 [Desulfoplanes formicivorans]|uniref:Uncharacterized protein n=1 Tax=Desulfoplanes formicivorans TaxID=1592317 RepID=A0A194AGE2_9BACT|nr:hypothetical protein DPF_1862 [Desulfoplanes formicivorans]
MEIPGLTLTKYLNTRKAGVTPNGAASFTRKKGQQAWYARTPRDTPNLASSCDKRTGIYIEQNFLLSTSREHFFRLLEHDSKMPQGRQSKDNRWKHRYKWRLTQASVAA